MPRFLPATSGSGGIAGGPRGLGSRISLGAEMSSTDLVRKLKEIHQSLVEDPPVSRAGSCVQGDGGKGQES